MLPDLFQTRQAIRSGALGARTEMERCLSIATSEACHHAFIGPLFESAPTNAERVPADAALAGLAVSIKDLFDIAGQPTPAGSVVLSHSPPAPADAPAVARLVAAGGVPIGRTNMSEFAFSGVGVNPHHGTPANAADGSTKRVPGGSSSGAAVSVATGAAFIGLGSDTGGSIRIPAALNGIVGFKSTARWVPTQGALPLSTTLDTVCAMTRSVRDAILAHEILAARRVSAGPNHLRDCRFAVARELFQDGMDPAVARAFESALSKLSVAGARIEEISLPALADLPAINSTGGFSAAESYAWHRLLLERSAAGYDPRVAQRILRGAPMRAFEYIDLIHARAQWIDRMTAALEGFDAVLSPTVPVTAPPIADVAPGAERDDAFFALNALLLRNPSVINMLDGCAISLPCHSAGDLPVGLMIWHAGLRDDHILGIALLAESQLRE
ncbi:amidase [Variovorax dokdonensis]|uniref:Amidase n=1 Tax=Variovorax dokdonensis TaxID=344883 RepID=A0ABT7N8P3_9BURK|nr:amidase [Variovorax dokdonensis]MDM0044311.1 amidase [Variovorax dokdonensis]